MKIQFLVDDQLGTQRNTHLNMNNLSTGELKELLETTENSLFEKQKEIKKTSDEYDFISGQLHDLELDIVELGDKIDDLESEEEELMNKIEQIEAKIAEHFEQNGPFYSYKELEQAGQMVISL